MTAISAADVHKIIVAEPAYIDAMLERERDIPTYVGEGVAIAARGDGHLAILSELAEILLDPDRARALRDAQDPDEVVRLPQPIAVS